MLEPTDKESLLRSQHSLNGPFGSIDDIKRWLKERNQAVTVDVKLVDFASMAHWRFNSDTGDLEHDSGKFFAIRGLDVKTEGCPYRTWWQQPIIDQPEIGFLGIIAKEIDGVLCFLLQAKIEPGNINNVQLSPTLQATRSNYMQVHKGKVPRYLEYFRSSHKYGVLIDQLQSEQGGRFLHKRNRNIILKINEDIPVYEDFIWVTFGQIKKLMCCDNVINMDTRTVLSGLSPLDSDSTQLQYQSCIGMLPSSHLGAEIFRSRMAYSGYRRIDQILSWLAELKSNYLLGTKLVPLKNLQEWHRRDDEIVRDDRKYFRVIGTQITIDNREVSSWFQPLVQPMQEGLCALIMKRVQGTIHVLVQAKLECGNFDTLEFAPTVQCLTGNYREHTQTYTPHYLEYVLDVPPECILWDVKQSEEGGRFFREQNRNMILLADDDFPDELPSNFCWMTLGQVMEFLRFNNYLNIQLRSLLALIDEFAVGLEKVR